MIIATWNVNSLKVRLPHVLAWLAEFQPDILALQETKSTNENFPYVAIEAAGYQVVFNGQKTFNGVAIISRAKSKEVMTDIPALVDPQRRILAATIDGVRVINLYVPNGESLTSEKYIYKMDWLNKVKGYLQQQLTEHAKLIVLGDFNIAPDERDVHDPNLWQGRVLFSDPERSAFQDFLQLGLHDTFRLFTKEPENFTWWDYRQVAFLRNWGLRIDHILASESLAKICKHCVIDKKPRQLERPSDHAPVMAEFFI